MNRTTLGATGLSVSAVGFGGIPITRLTETAAAQLVRAAFDAGINFFDTAWGYPGSEERLALGLGGVDRAQLVIATKDGSTDGAMFRKHALESLGRLAVDYVDVLQFHNLSDRRHVDAVMAPGGAYEAALGLRDEGRVRHIGVTCHNTELAAELVASGKFETLQVPINFIADEAESLVAECARRSVGFIAMKPFAGGAIEDGELALRYLQQFPTVVPIPGIEKAEELRQVVELYNAPLPPTEDQRQRMGRIREEIGRVFCRACGYCQPCPQEIAIAMVLRAQSFVKRMSTEFALRAVGHHVAKVDSCLDCRQCVERCPYHLDIPAMLRQNSDWFQEWRKTVPQP
jgi:hypothetical protein